MLKRKNNLIKINVPRHDHTMGLRVVATEAFCVWLAAKKDTSDGARRQLMWCRGGDIRITKATENMKIII